MRRLDNPWRGAVGCWAVLLRVPQTEGLPGCTVRVVLALRAGAMYLKFKVFEGHYSQIYGTYRDMRQFLGFVFSTLCFLSAGLTAAPLKLAPGHPDSYTVKVGDTLWDIAGHFLREPWQWPEIWLVNPEIRDPHLIYPGDVIHLSYDADGNPRLGIGNKPGTMREVSLSPGVRREALVRSVPTIPIDAILQFLSRPRVMDRVDMESAPKLKSFVKEHIVGGAGDAVYADSIEDPDILTFDVMRPGKAYIDPDTNETLGYEAAYVGDAEVLRAGTPAKLVLTTIEDAARLEDIFLPDPEEEVLSNFQPRPAPALLEGRIIDVLNGVNQIGQFNLVVLNKGEADGLEPGHVFIIMQRSDPPRGQRSRNVFYRTPALPLEEVGTLMVFRSFDRVSYAMVMTASNAIRVLDSVRSPEE